MNSEHMQQLERLGLIPPWVTAHRDTPYFSTETEKAWEPGTDYKYALWLLKKIVSRYYYKEDVENIFHDEALEDLPAQLLHFIVPLEERERPLTHGEVCSLAIHLENPIFRREGSFDIERIYPPLDAPFHLIYGGGNGVVLQFAAITLEVATELGEECTKLLFERRYWTLSTDRKRTPIVQEIKDLLRRRGLSHV